MDSRRRTGLAPSARLALRFIARHIKEVGWAPNYREIQEATDIKSPSVVSYALKQLAEDGYIKHKPGDARAMCMTDAGHRYLQEEGQDVA